MNKRIKDVRLTLGLSQTEIGDKTGFSRNYIYMMESGKKPVSDKYVKALIKTYGVNENWLRSGIGDRFSKTTREEEIAGIAAEVFKEDSTFRTMLIKEICDAPADTLDQIYSYVKYIVDMSKKKNDRED